MLIRIDMTHLDMTRKYAYRITHNSKLGTSQANDAVASAFRIIVRLTVCVLVFDTFMRQRSNT